VWQKFNQLLTIFCLSAQFFITTENDKVSKLSQKHGNINITSLDKTKVAWIDEALQTLKTSKNVQKDLHYSQSGRLRV